MVFTLDAMHERKERLEIQTELHHARIAGDIYVMLFQVRLVNLDPSEEIPGRRIDELDLNSPVSERYVQYFRRVKAGESLLRARKKELSDSDVKYVRTYRVPTNPPVFLSSYEPEDYLVNI